MSARSTKPVPRLGVLRSLLHSSHHRLRPDVLIGSVQAHASRTSRVTKHASNPQHRGGTRGLRRPPLRRWRCRPRSHEHVLDAAAAISSPPRGSGTSRPSRQTRHERQGQLGEVSQHVAAPLLCSARERLPTCPGGSRSASSIRVATDAISDTTHTNGVSSNGWSANRMPGHDCPPVQLNWPDRTCASGGQGGKVSNPRLPGLDAGRSTG